MAGRNPYQGGGKPKIPRRLLEFDDLYQAVQNLLYGSQNTKDMMILLPEERTDVQGRTLPDPVPNGVWAWNHDASAPRYFTPEQFYAEMPVSLHLDQLQDLHAQTLALRNQAQEFRDSAMLFANDSTVSAGLSSGFASQAQGFANGAASSKLDADEAAIQAAGSASASQEHANSSQSCAQTAGTHATSAQTNANKAQAWASNPVGVPVEANLYSARHYAQEAANAATGSMRFKGTWDASVGSYPDAPATGDFYRISVAGTISGRELNPGDQIFFDGAGWDHIDNTDRVMSVNGQTGNVQLTSEQIAGFGSLAAKDQVDWTTDLINIPDLAPLSHTHNKGDVDLSNVDNTSDMEKPVSTATATALAAKANTTHTHTIANVTGLQTALDGKQAAGSYAAATHTHSLSEVTNFAVSSPANGQVLKYNSTTGKWTNQADNNTVYSVATLAELQTGTATTSRVLSAARLKEWADWQLTNFSVIGHTHTIANVTGLQAALDGKQAAGSYAAASHTHTIANVSGLQGALETRPQVVLDGDWLSTSGAYVSVSTITDAANSSFRWTAPADYTNIVSFPTKDAYSGLALATSFGSGNRFWLRGRHDTRGPTAWERWKPWMEVALHGTNVSFQEISTTGPNAIRVGAATNSTEGYITYYTAGDGTTRTAYMGYGSSGSTVFSITNERGGYINLESQYVHILDSNGGGMQLRPTGEIWLGDANNRAYQRRQPRIFVQSGDPGAAATDGDLWIW